MRKKTVVELLGGQMEAARRIGITYQAVSKWPSKLPSRIVDRAIAAFVREGRPVPPELIVSDSKLKKRAEA